LSARFCEKFVPLRSGGMELIMFILNSIQQQFALNLTKQLFGRSFTPQGQNKILQEIVQSVTAKAVNRANLDTVNISDLKRQLASNTGENNQTEMRLLPDLSEALALLNPPEIWINPEPKYTIDMTLIPPSEKDGFSKEDALLAQYMKQYRLDARIENGELVFNSPINEMPPLNVSEEELEAFRQSLAENGLAIDIDWKGVYDDMWGISVGFDNAGALITKVDYLASRYAVLLNRIEENFSSDEKAEQLNTLNQIFKDAVETLAITFAQSVGAFYDEFADPGESEKMYNSLVAGILSRIEEYQNHMSKAGDFSGIADESEKWLLLDDAYMAARLRESIYNEPASGLTASNRRDAEYELNDLSYAAIVAKEMYRTLGSNLLEYTDSRNAGLKLASQAIKIDQNGKSTNISDKMTALIDKAFGSYMLTLLDNVDQLHEKLNSQSAAKGVKVAAQGLDLYFAYEVYSHIMQQYKK
jgi:hypothetical protein